MAKFTVDTHLFRELGELLVGRDSTALVELIKNSYDADSSYAVVDAGSLNDPLKGWIEVSDDGVGMTPDVFNDGFLRIASRRKSGGTRRSPVHGRKITGEKGIGRLAAHKLAKVLTVVSIPRSGFGTQGVSATIDWGSIEDVETFDELGEIPVKEIERESKAGGTRIRLTELRRPWTAAELGRFLAEVESFEAPDLLVRDLRNDSDVAGPLIVGTPVVRDVSNKDPGFLVDLRGDFDRGDDYWSALWSEVDWVLEIDATADGVDYSVAPTRFYLKGEPNAEGAKFTGVHPDPDDGISFQARVLIREGAIRDKQTLSWARRVSGVRVYHEGFRVLPYGEPGDDWIGIEQRSTRRSRDLDWLEDARLDAGDAVTDEGLQSPSNSSLVGGVFLTEERAPGLRMLVNREGFVPERSFYVMREIVRVGVDLSTRVRAAASLPRRETRRALRREETSDTTSDESGDVPSLQTSLERLGDLVRTANESLDSGDVPAAREALKGAATQAEEVTSVTGAMIAERAMLRVLASIGLQMSAFVHETNTTLRMAGDLESEVSELRESDQGSTSNRKDLARIARALADLRRNVERQASFLLDVVTPDARRRRTAQPLRMRFDAAAALLEDRARKRGVSIDNDIPATLRSPPMFSAEVTTVFANLLTNAVKAAGEGGQILATGSLEGKEVRVVIANTGEAVDLEAAERWFRPFESTTVEIDPLLGRGLGLGLPITRSVVEEYGGDVRFVKHPEGYATAVQVTLPGGRER